MNEPSIIQQLKNPSQDDVYVLDIDSTLVTTHQRNQSILDSWIKNNRAQFANECAQLQKSTCQFGDYGLRNLFQRVEFTDTNSVAKNHLETYWRENFFSNNFLHADVPTRGAVHWVQDLEEKGIDFFYLTARHKSTMWEGTLSSLDEKGFPISPENLFLKEDLTESDEEYKVKTLARLFPKYTGKRLWLIDNEPVVLNKIKAEAPEVHLIWFESTHSGKMNPPAGVPKINQFCFD